MKQLTLKASFTLSGKGLHTGAFLTATFNPAPDNHGYKIRRIDLDGQPVIDAVAENVTAWSHCLCLLTSHVQEGGGMTLQSCHLALRGLFTSYNSLQKGI